MQKGNEVFKVLKYLWNIYYLSKLYRKSSF